MNRGRDDFRIARMKEQMQAAGLDLLVVRLAENVLYTTGYWPVNGSAMAVIPLEGEPTLFYVEGEEEFVAEGWVEDARAYYFFDLQNMANSNRDFARMLKALWQEKGYNPKATIGYEGSFELIAGNNVAAEARCCAEPSMAMLRAVLPEARLVDASAAIMQARYIKSALEIELIRTCCDIAGMGYAAAREMMIPGVTEAEVAAAVEARMYGRGVGFRGVRRSRGFCFAMSGPNAAMARRPFCISNNRGLERGDVVLLELDAFADGYYIDLTRTMSVGEPTQQAQEAWGIINEAVEAALSITRSGTPARELNRVARQVIIDRGYGEYFRHHVGHGVGLQFHEPPTLHPASTETLEASMAISIEPAFYIPGWGGMRIEENVAITDDGYEPLSIYPRQL